jgi:hypothetical protein
MAQVHRFRMAVGEAVVLAIHAEGLIRFGLVQDFLRKRDAGRCELSKISRRLCERLPRIGL